MNATKHDWHARSANFHHRVDSDGTVATIRRTCVVPERWGFAVYDRHSEKSVTGLAESLDAAKVATDSLLALT